MTELNEKEFLKSAEMWDNRELGCDERYVSRVSKSQMDKINKTLGLVEVKFKISKELYDILSKKASDSGVIISEYLRQLIR